MQKNIIGLSALIIALLLAASAGAQLCPNVPANPGSGDSYSPWPKFNYNNENTSKTFNFGTQIGRLKWQFVTGAPVTSSPVLHCTVDSLCYSACMAETAVSSKDCYTRCQECTVYVGSADNNFYAIDAQTGEVSWLYRTEAAIELASAAIDENHQLYFGSNDGYLYAFDLETVNKQNPQPVWIFNTRTEALGKGVSSSTRPRAAINSSPAIDSDGTIIFACNNGFLYALRPNGSLKWRREITPSWSSPAINVDDGIVYIGSWDGFADVSVYRFTLDCDGDNETDDYQITTGYGYENFWILNADDGSDFYTWPGWRGNAPFGTLPQDWDFPPGTPPEDLFLSLDTDGLCAWIASQPVPANDGEYFYTRYAVPGFTCVPGGIIAAPAITPSDNVLLAWLTTYSAWPDWCETENSNDNLWYLPVSAGVGWTISDAAPMYSTPAVIEDGSFYAVSGNTVYRGLPDSLSYYTIATIGERSECSPSIDGALNIYLGSNGGYFYCINANSPQDPVLWQYPSEDEPALKNPNGQVASITSSPAIGDDARRSVYVGASDGNVYAFFDGARIYGKVLLESVDDAGNTVLEPLRGVKISLTVVDTDNESAGEPGEQAVPRVTYTNIDGDYEFQAVGDGSYRIDPERKGFVFKPSSRNATVEENLDVEANFLATGGYSISGTIRTFCESPMPGVSVVLRGVQSGTVSTITDEQGGYIFSNVGYDTYTVTPFKDGYSFQPPSYTVTLSETNAADILELDFCAFEGYQISGSIRRSFDNEPLEGVVVDMEGSVGGITVKRKTETDVNGAYVFTGIESGEYTITPALANYSFDPVSETVTIAASSSTGVNFTAISSMIISGRIVVPGDSSLLTRVKVNLYNYSPSGTASQESIANVQPDQDGEFIFGDVSRGRYIVKPELSGWGFEPLSSDVMVPSDSATGLVFTAVEGLYIAGRVVNIFGRGLSDVTVELITNDEFIQTLTAVNGSFAFYGLESGSYTVQPADDFYKSFPNSRPVSLVTESRDDLLFVSRTTCETVYATLPPFGAEGVVVNIYGINFGMTIPSEDQLVDITFGGQSYSLPAGVYFSNGDPTTWIRAEKIINWFPFKIAVEAPGGFGFYKVYVITGGQDCFSSGMGGFFFSLY